MIPILHSPGVITPGQLGPISRVAEPSMARFTLTMSSMGMPSVMQTTSGRPASTASRMESAANGGGTKITLAFAPVCSTVYPSDGKEMARALVRSDHAHRGAEGVSRDPLAGEISHQDLPEPAAQCVAVLVVLRQPIRQIVDVAQLVAREGERDPVLAEHRDEMLGAVAEVRRARLPEDVAEDGRDEPHLTPCWRPRPPCGRHRPD